jgi:uncharacterized damage-inducible protein DinB
LDTDIFWEQFLKITLHRMCDLYFLKLKESLQRLTKEQLWGEPYTSANSIGGIVLHISEHIERCCLRLTNNESMLKEGFENYFPKENMEVRAVVNHFENRLIAWKTVINQYINKEHELKIEHIHVLCHVVEHTGYHLGQVIDRVQGTTSTNFHFCQNGLNENYLREKVDSDV